MKETRTILDNGMVQITRTSEVKRYVGKLSYDEFAGDYVRESIKENCKVCILAGERYGFDSLDTGESFEPERESVKQDIALYQDYLDSTYGKGKYKSYAIGAYIHSGVSFAFNTDEDRRCQWDSGTIGFIGIPTDQNINVNEYASNLNDAWNGMVELYQIWDNLDGEMVDEINSLETMESIAKWKNEMKEKYGVDGYTMVE